MREWESNGVTEIVNLPRSAYIHIPFCRRRCYYCDFPISVVGDTLNGSNSGTIARYVEVLTQEIRLTPVRSPLETVFFGGGTPSLLSAVQVAELLEVLSEQFGITSTAEISMEIDPGTFDLEQLQGYKAAGVNRVSLGVQAFQPELLAACGRSHTLAEVYMAVEQIQQVGIGNFSLDLISGLPHQTLADWQDSLMQAIALEPVHLSCYDLTIETGTPFSRQYRPGNRPLPDDETTAEMYRTAQQLLTQAGYEHYEISNYAKLGYQCQHNRTYWENRPFYGFGMGATSYVNGARVARPRKTREYYAWVESQRTSSIANAARTQVNTDQLLDTLMLGLRLVEGLELEQLIQQFGDAAIAQVWKCLRPYGRLGWVVLECAGEEQLSWATAPVSALTGRIRFTDPEGFLFSNVMLVKLFEQFETPESA
jgi:oxygen-independent coproporphyrinogen-3 oxidase